MRSYYYFLIVFLFMPIFIFAQTETLRIETFYGRGGAGISTTENEELAKDADAGLAIGDLLGEPVNKLEVKGNAAIGAGYAGNFPASADGLIVEGRVGIGTTDPLTNKLVVDTGVSGLKLKVSGDALTLDDASSNNYLPYIQWRESEDVNAPRAMYLGWGSTVAGNKHVDMTLENTYKLAITGGNVGIGTKEPQGLLEVRSTSSYSYRRDIKILDAAFVPRCPCDTSIWTEECGTDFTSSIDLGPVCYDHFMGSYSHKYTREGSYLIVKDDGKVGIGTAEPEGKLDVAGKIYEQGNPLLPKGVIVIWSGNATDIPAGWALCDGNNGTPNLQSRFIVGAGSTSYNPGATGGEDAVILEVSQIPLHYHLYQTGYNTALTTHGTNGSFGGGTPDDTSYVYMSQGAGGGLKHENRPPYYALCYIMKL